MKVVEVTQDGAGIFLYGDTEAIAMYTRGVESCRIYAFYGERGFCVIHDTGQLSTDSMCAVASRCGVIKKAYCAKNSVMELRAHPLQLKSHDERMRNICQRLDVKDMESLSIPRGEIAFLMEGSAVLGKDEISELVKNLDSDKKAMIRSEINVINNLFLKKNSKSLCVDVQYENGAYTETPMVAYTRKYMEDRAEKEAQKGDPDYRRALNRAVSLGIIPISD